MSPEGTKYLLLGLIPLAFFALWLRTETKTASPYVRVGSGIVAGLSFSLWLLSLSNSLGSYYDGMREHRLLASLIRGYPAKTTEIGAWAANYKFYKDFEYHVTKRGELKAITENAFPMTNTCTLIIAVLSVESSYLQEVERPTKNVPDTVQFWFAPDSQWRIKTFAIDHDIHVHRIGISEDGARLTPDFATNNIQKSYGDVTAKVLTLEFRDPKNEAEVERVLNAHKLKGKLQAVKDGYYFYNPDGGDYRTKSKPK